MCTVSNAYVWHNPSICVAWCIHVRDLTHLYKRQVWSWESLACYSSKISRFLYFVTQSFFSNHWESWDTRSKIFKHCVSTIEISDLVSFCRILHLIEFVSVCLEECDVTQVKTVPWLIHAWPDSVEFVDMCTPRVCHVTQRDTTQACQGCDMTHPDVTRMHLIS